MSSETKATIATGAAIVGVLLWQISTVNTRIDDMRDTVNTRIDDFRDTVGRDIGAVDRRIDDFRDNGEHGPRCDEHHH